MITALSIAFACTAGWHLNHENAKVRLLATLCAFISGALAAAATFGGVVV